jgi:hypothetical protein
VRGQSAMPEFLVLATLLEKLTQERGHKKKLGMVDEFLKQHYGIGAAPVLPADAYSILRLLLPKLVCLAICVHCTPCEC